MDNICHTLVGAALAETGLKRRTALGTMTLVIAANAPDIDVLAIPFGRGIDFRRGHTHGVIALIVLPLVLALVMALWQRVRGRRFGEPLFSFRATLLLAAIGVFTHPFLAWMNTYGVRWLMPFDGRWFSAETLFIVDPVLWILLGAGWFWGRRLDRQHSRTATRPARWALAASGAYIALMMVASLWTRFEVIRDLAARDAAPDRIVVSPRPVSVIVREVIHERDGVYRFGRATLFAQPMLVPSGDSVPRQADHPAARIAAATPIGRQFLVWSRMPFFSVQQGGDQARVRLDDARYSRGEPSWAAVYVRLDARDGRWVARDARATVPR